MDYEDDTILAAFLTMPLSVQSSTEFLAGYSDEVPRLVDCAITFTLQVSVFLVY